MKIKWREIFLFSFLAYFFTWLYWLTAILTKNPAHPFYSVPFIGEGLGMFGPMLATAIMRKFITREGFKNSMGLKRPIKFYLIAFFAPLLFVIALISFNQITGIGQFRWTYTLPLRLSFIISAGLVFLVLPLGIGEEYGWRGYLLPRLLPLGEIRGTVILGIIWTFWHLPVLFLRQGPFWLSIPLFLIFAVLLAFPFTWLYRASAGSVLVCALFHTSFDVWGDTFTSKVAYPAQNQLLVGAGGIISTIFLTVIIISVYTIFKRSPK